MNLRSQVALVTGGSRGLGLLIAQELARRGCDLAICARDELELAQAAERIDGEVVAIPCDVSDRLQVAEVVRIVTDRFGRIDILVNNAGIIQVGPVAAMSEVDFARAMQINFGVALAFILEVLPEMRARKSGRIANITSIGGKLAVPRLLPYDCAKFALVGLSEGLRAELASDGITVTTVVPGLTPYAEATRHAARRIVNAIARGEAEVTLTWPAKLLRLMHDLMPGFTSDALGVVNRLLPGSSAAAARRS